MIRGDHPNKGTSVKKNNPRRVSPVAMDDCRMPPGKPAPANHPLRMMCRSLIIDHIHARAIQRVDALHIVAGL